MFDSVSVVVGTPPRFIIAWSPSHVKPDGPLLTQPGFRIDDVLNLVSKYLWQSSPSERLYDALMDVSTKGVFNKGCETIQKSFNKGFASRVHQPFV